MSLRRITVIVLSAVGALLVAAVLYLAFGDLGRHKGRIEALVTGLLERPFAIDGAFELELLPSIALTAERVRLGNAPWGSQPQMAEVGGVSLRIGTWSLLSGPVDIRSLELKDVSVLLETNADGKGNWVFGEADEKKAKPASGSAAVPAVIRSATVGNVRISYREGKQDKVALVETLSIGPGSDGLLAISGKGSLHGFPATVSGELGPEDALFSGRNIRAALQATLGDLKADVKGSVGRLDPLDGADLVVKLANPDIGAMLKKLGLPIVATGSLAAEARLTDAGDLTRLDLAAKVGDTTVKVEGTLRALGLPGSDLRFQARVADLRRLAAAFDLTGLPAGALEADGHLASSRTEIKLDGVSARFAEASARVDGTVRPARGSADLRFELATKSLAKVRRGLPEIPLSINGTYAGNRDKLEVKNLKGRIGASEFSARASMAEGRNKRMDVEISSPRLDLTPFLAQKTKPQPKKPAPKFVFDEEPLPLDRLKLADAKIRFSAAEIRLDAGVLRNVESTLLADGGRLTLEGHARDNLQGTLRGAVKLTPADGGAAALDISVSAQNMRSGLSGGSAIDPKDVPPTSVEGKLVAKGASARQMAAGANGQILVTQGPGKVQSGVIGLIGGDLLRELVDKLNPFSAKDPYTQVECTVIRADIVDGQAKVSPLLVQSEKVTIVAGGLIDLRTEALKFDFNTRPRTGVGISAGMFTNPFIEVAGTLASPRLGVGAKGVTSGAAAVATSGISVLAQGLFDRARGQQDVCKQTLSEATGKAK